MVSSIICDVSGTHTRVAFVKNGEIKKLREYLTKDITSIKNLISMYVYLEKLDCKNIVLSVAGKVSINYSELNHKNLTVKRKDLEQIGFEKICLLNDFEALSYGVLDVKNYNDITPLINTEKYLVIGAGTGLGVCFFENNFAVDNEEGHANIDIFDIDSLTLREQDFLNSFEDKCEIEGILSGRGIERIFHYFGGGNLSAEEISNLETKTSKETFDLFYSFYLKVTIYFAQKYDVYQVFVAGGIIMKNMKYFDLEQKEKWIGSLGTIGCRVLLDYDVSLYGLKNVVLRESS